MAEGRNICTPSPPEQRQVGTTTALISFSFPQPISCALHVERSTSALSMVSLSSTIATILSIASAAQACGVMAYYQCASLQSLQNQRERQVGIRPSNVHN
jgi:hypothetical protein